MPLTTRLHRRPSTHAGARRPDCGGFASVEHVGVVVLAAVLLAALAAWAKEEIRPPDRPPAVIEVAALPLHPRAIPVSDGRFSWRIQPTLENLDRVVRAVRDTTVELGTVTYIFGRAFLSQLGTRVRHYVRNPEAFLTDMYDSLQGLARDPLRNLGPQRIRELRDYIRTLRSLPLREAVHRLADDAGTFSANLLIDYVTRAAAKRIVGRVVHPAPSPPGPPPAPPPPPQP